MTRLQPLVEALSALRDDAITHERALQGQIRLVPEDARPSARNLAHYLSLRQHDVRELQAALARLGLSSLGRCEAHTMAALDAVTNALSHLAGTKESAAGADRSKDCVDFESGPAQLDNHTRTLFGPPPRKRSTRIMVTMSSEAATDPTVIHDLVGAGMDVMRINCAHDDVVAWTAMVNNLRRAEKRHRRSCKILVDLAGPKLRTGALEAVPGTIKVKPARDERGFVQQQAHVFFTPEDDAAQAPAEAEAIVPVRIRGDWPPAGSNLLVEDTRGRKRRLHIEQVSDRSCLCSVSRTVYFSEGLALVPEKSVKTKPRAKGKTKHQAIQIGALPTQVLPIELHVGDRLVLSKSATPGHPALPRRNGKRAEPARIPCTLPQVFRDARNGQPIWLDDGKIGGVIRKNDGKSLTIEVTHAPAEGAKLLPDKGINLPDSNLRVPGLTEKDLEDLKFALEHADMVGLSFVQRPADVAELQRLLAAGTRKVGIVLKIETRRAFEALPRLLLAGLRASPIGVMVARGDLAVEVGFLRLAEVQEEILWLCEAAHVPVVWATQVLESLAKKGAPSRAEVTDAAMGVRAECVMLNKGPHIVRAVAFLADILHCMQAHQHKKTTRLRRLSIATTDSAPARARAARAARGPNHQPTQA